MAEVNIASSSSNLDIAYWMKRGDIAFAAGLICILGILIIPLPLPILDFSFAISIGLSVLIMMTTLFIQRPLDFSSFPTVLLITTMIRLSLNVASTRIILTSGHEGTHSAGKVIQAFGNFLMSGNFVIGLIVFAILVVVNFVVITKGSGRIAEVSARFSLDAMPGKQMAIDADLSSGLIDENIARQRRTTLENESNFYGSMDGAAKFVRGDAIAGLLITFINIVGGIIIGIVQKDLGLMEALKTYTVLSVGDGLIAQIPALIISTSAGLLVSKSGIDGTTDKALFSQLGGYPAALGMCSFLMIAMSLIPQMPFIPFAILGIVAGSAAYKSSASVQEEVETTEKAKEIIPEKTPEQALAEALKIDPVKIEIGYGLINLLNNENGYQLTDHVKSLRKQLANEMGFILPSVRILDNVNIQPNEYVFIIKEFEIAKADIRPNQFLVMNPTGEAIEILGEPTVEPTFGLKAVWIGKDQKSIAEQKGYTVVDAATVMMTHLTEVIKDNIADLLTFADIQHMLENLSEPYKKLLNDIVPNQISVANIQKVLQNLLNERISIRDINTILEGIAEACQFSRNITMITEHVRLRLTRQITFSNFNEDGQLPILTLSPDWEQSFLESLVGDSEIKKLAMAPSKIQEFITLFNKRFDQFILSGESPILITSAALRPYIRSIIERIRPSAIIMAQPEVHPKANIKNLGQL